MKCPQADDKHFHLPNTRKEPTLVAFVQPVATKARRTDNMIRRLSRQDARDLEQLPPNMLGHP